MTDDEITTKKAQAAQHRGVWYDSRSDRFAAEVYSCGKRHFLGLHTTAEEAADAYTTARLALPTGRKTGSAFSAAFAAMLDGCGADGPAAGDSVLYDGQTFTFERLAFTQSRGKRRPLYEWSSHCADCGAAYTTQTATSPDVARGITRRCSEHARGGRRKQAAPEGDVSQELADAISEVAAGLSLADDSVTLLVFAKACHDRGVSPPPSYLARDPRSPVVLEHTDDGMICRFK